MQTNRYLIDTHILIWWLENSPKLSDTTKSFIFEHSVWVSAASLWEISLKEATGKLTMDEDYFQHVEAENFHILEISAQHALAVNTLPLIHKDPFDRLLVAQAQSEELTLITADKILSQYPIKTLLA